MERPDFFTLKNGEKVIRYNFITIYKLKSLSVVNVLNYLILLVGQALNGIKGPTIDEKISKFNEEISKLIIVTGKGLHSQNEKDPYVSKDFGILKYSVPEFIKNNNELMNMINKIQDADMEDGGGGAFYIYLKKKLIK